MPTPVATHITVEQGTDEWLEARLGRATASRFADILAVIKSGEAAGRRNYRAELVVERLTGTRYDRFKSDAMQWGNETEELAATEYMLRSGNKVEECGFYQHKKHMVGASPDRLVDDKGLIEIKCLNTANHIEVLRLDTMPMKHMPQVQGQLWLTGREWCDFVSFDPAMPAAAQIFIERIPRDEQYIKMLKASVLEFLDEVEEEVAFIKNYKPKGAANA